ncbi:hypothetical protein L6470_03655 [Prevotella communis]|uniref:hypothetical protein n=1 Tax=Prevotella communis TaxID=2913614 RepID=UPI001EDA0F3B|nr:hypothetical protein [Prevotella communis]UKK60117.1 hypothetical protein L6470_03655 [Prevotella communis]
MKMNKILMGLAVMAGGLFASCDTDNEGTVYNVYTPNVSFEASKTEKLVSDSETEVKVLVTRFGTNGEYTMHYTGAADTEGIFTDENNGTVTFANGSNKAYITLKAGNMEKGNSYTYTMVMSDEDVATADTIIGNPVQKIDVVVTCDYTWELFGTGVFSSPEAMGGAWKQKIYRAKEEPTLYKLPATGYEYDLKITIKDDGTVIVPFQPAWSYPGYGDVYVWGNALGDYAASNASEIAGTYNKETGVITFNMFHYLAAIQYSFGTFTDTFTFDAE